MNSDVALFDYILLLVCCVLSVEVFIRSKIIRRVGDSASAAKKAVRVLSTDSISDHWKEKAIQSYAALIFRNSAKVLAILTLALLPFVLAAWYSPILIDYVLSSVGSVVTLVMAAGYVAVRRT